MSSNNNKYVFIVGQLGAGGLERQLLYLCEGLKKNGNTVMLYCWNDTEHEFFYKQFQSLLGENIINGKGSSLKKVAALIKICNRFSPKAVISFTGYTNIIAFLAGLFSGTRSFGSVRRSGSYMLKKKGMASMLSLYLPRTILVNSQATIEELKVLKFSGKMKYLPNAIDIAAFKRSDVPKLYDSISVGTVKSEKRLDRMLAYCQEMVTKYAGFRHVHVGGGVELAALEARAVKEGLKDVISFTGTVSDPGYYLDRSKILVHFSDFEGTPNVVLEAMAKELPVVTTNCGDVVHYIKDGINGYVVRHFDAVSFAAHCVDILTDVSLQNNYGKAALQMIKPFDKQFIARKFIELTDGKQQ